MKERILDRAQGIEKCSPEVEDKVDAGELLEHLSRCTDERPAKVRRRISDRASETVGLPLEVAAFGYKLVFVFVVGDDFGEFLLDVDSTGCPRT